MLAAGDRPELTRNTVLVTSALSLTGAVVVHGMAQPLTTVASCAALAQGNHASSSSHGDDPKVHSL